jgi:hypothetical protein
MPASPGITARRSATAQTFEGTIEGDSAISNDRQLHQMFAVAPSNGVAHRITNNGGKHDDQTENANVDTALARDDARHDDGGFTGQHKANEERCFTKDQYHDQC